MPTTFLHMADVHLGYQQYQSEERFKDFSRAFRQATEDAIEKKVDFVLIAGDLFHKAAINPITLLQAKRPLDQLREANISTIAINGNHDGTRYGSQFSWLDYLEADRCLTVLKPTFSKNGQIQLTPSNGSRGGYIDLKGVRIIGLPYLGASTPSILTELPAVLQKLPRMDTEFTVLMGHFGLEGEAPNLNGAISPNIIAPLKSHVNYLALGHVHKPVEREGWVYNPGSLEACGMDERNWRGGWYHVTVDTGAHKAQHIKSKRRHLHRIKIEVDKFNHPTALYDAIRVELEDYKRALTMGHLKPVVQIWLDGVLAFDRHDLDTRYIEQILIEVIDPLKALVRNNTRSTEYEVVMDERLNRTELELKVLADLIMRDSRYRDQAEAWARLMSEVKGMVLTGHDPATIALAISKQISLLEAAAETASETELKDKLAQLKAKLETENVD